LVTTTVISAATCITGKVVCRDYQSQQWTKDHRRRDRWAHEE